jgi:hypothetical protein
MPNKNKGKQNQPPTGEGKKQSPYSGQENKLNKRSEVAQAQRNHPEENYGANAEDEGSGQGLDQQKDNPKRQKAGR